MLIKLKKGTVIAGIPNCPVGIPFEVPEHIGRFLIVTNKAVQCFESQRITVPVIEKIESREPGIENREPEVVHEPAPRGRRRAARLP